MFITNNRALFHLLGKENFVKHQKSQNIMKMIEYCFEYVTKKYETLTISLHMKICIKIEIKITCKNKT